MSLMDCVYCDQFRSEHERLEQIYANAVNALSARPKKAPLTEYRRLRIAADDARIDAEVARLECEKHQRMHRAAN
jgi:hypothetical protein